MTTGKSDSKSIWTKNPRGEKDMDFNYELLEETKKEIKNMCFSRSN